MSQSISAYATLGRWDECTTAATPLLAGPADLNAASAAGPMVTIAAARGDEQTLERCRFIAEERRESAHVDEQVAGAMVRLREMIEHGDAAEAAPLVRAALEIPTTGHEIREQVLALGAEAAIMSADDSFLAELIRYVDELPPALATPLLRSGRARLRAEEAHRAGNEADAEVYEREAIDLLRDVGARPLLALALLERNRRRGDDEALAEARAIYADLGATAWLTRIDEPSGLAA
jgi:hypothetical protein